MTEPPDPRGGRPVLDPGGGGVATAGAIDAGDPKVFVTRDPTALAAAAAVRLAERLVEAVAWRGRADIALTGGSTPAAMYERLLDPQLRQRVDWSRVHLWWGDERYVPRGDPLSNTFLADQVLLADGGLPSRPAGPPLPDGRCPDRRARTGLVRGDLCRRGRGSVPLVDGWPSFDVVLVGIGGDGHVLSVFPDSPALTSDRVALAIPAPTHIEPAVERVSLNPAILVVARRVLALASGAAKAAIVARVLRARATHARCRPSSPGARRRRGCSTGWLRPDGRGPPIRRDQRGRPGAPPAGCIERCR